MLTGFLCEIWKELPPLGLHAFRFFVKKSAKRATREKWLPRQIFVLNHGKWKAAAVGGGRETLVCRLTKWS